MTLKNNRRKNQELLHYALNENRVKDQDKVSHYYNTKKNDLRTNVIDHKKKVNK